MLRAAVARRRDQHVLPAILQRFLHDGRALESLPSVLLAPRRDRHRAKRISQGADEAADTPVSAATAAMAAPAYRQVLAAFVGLLVRAEVATQRASPAAPSAPGVPRVKAASGQTWLTSAAANRSPGAAQRLASSVVALAAPLPWPAFAA